jgi:hypothetical protein
MSGNSGGATSFSGAGDALSTFGNAAVTLTGNSGHTIGFTGGGLAITTTTGNGLVATGGGTLTVTGTGNTISSSGATALNVAQATIGAGGLTFQSITAGSGTPSGGDGIILDTTGSNGGLTVTGVGTSAGSGGTIQNKTGANGATTSGVGIYLNNAANVSLKDMQLNDLGNYGIRGTGVSGFSFTYGTINGSNGASTPLAGASLAMDNLTGTGTISNSTITGGYHDDVRIANTSGTLNPLTFDSDTFAQTNADANGNDAMLITASGGTLNPTITNSHFTAARADLLHILSNGGATTTLTMNTASPNNSTFSNNNTGALTNNGDLVMSAGSANGNSTLNFDVQNATFRDSIGNAVAIGTAAGTGTNNATGKFINNTVGVSGAANSGSKQGSDLSIGTATGGAAHGTITVDIENNKLYQYNNDGIQLATDSTTAPFPTMNATVKGNTVAQPNTTFALNGLDVEAGASTGSASTMCLNASGNALTGSGVTAVGGYDMLLSENVNDTIQLQGYGGATDNVGQIQSFEGAQNTVGTVGVFIAPSPATGHIQAAPSNCPTPP